MQKRAFLIGGNYQRPDNSLSGVGSDISAWKQYLMSPYGGSWAEDEILDLSGRSKDNIVSMLQVGRTIDYSLVCFSGHGYLTKDRFGFNMTMTLIDDVVAMSERELNPGSPWCMQILDCCRRDPENEKVGVCDEAIDMSHQHDTRILFENELLKCERGLVKVFAADEGQAAADKKSFSRTLIEIARSAVETCQDGILRINDAVRFAQTEMPPQQTPVYMGGRRLHHFPFAVKHQAIY